MLLFGDIHEELPIAKATVSQHLKELKEAGLIQGEIEAPKVRYCINKENWKLAKKCLPISWASRYVKRELLRISSFLLYMFVVLRMTNNRYRRTMKSDRLNLPQFGFQGNAEGLARKGGWGALIIGALFALAFCPTSGVFYFGMLIPMSATATAGYLLPVVFAIATAIPVLVVAWILAFSVQQLGSFYGKMQKVQKWMNRIVGVLFIVIGIYYSWIMYL